MTDQICTSYYLLRCESPLSHDKNTTQSLPLFFIHLVSLLSKWPSGLFSSASLLVTFSALTLFLFIKCWMTGTSLSRYKTHLFCGCKWHICTTCLHSSLASFHILEPVFREKSVWFFFVGGRTSEMQLNVSGFVDICVDKKHVFRRNCTDDQWQLLPGTQTQLTLSIFDFYWSV